MTSVDSKYIEAVICVAWVGYAYLSSDLIRILSSACCSALPVNLSLHIAIATEAVTSAGGIRRFERTMPHSHKMVALVFRSMQCREACCFGPRRGIFGSYTEENACKLQIFDADNVASAEEPELSEYPPT
jgi:hypothetical protein